MTMQSNDKRTGSTYAFTDDSETSLFMTLRTAVNILSQAYGFTIDKAHVMRAGDDIIDDFFEEADEAFFGPDGARQLLLMAVKAAKQLQRYAELTTIVERTK